MVEVDHMDNRWGNERGQQQHDLGFEGVQLIEVMKDIGLDDSGRQERSDRIGCAFEGGHDRLRVGRAPYGVSVVVDQHLRDLALALRQRLQPGHG